ncbi:cytochrome c biogenesis CcdA family protein [Marinivivus vitaminiproducens]|uniref:cytochrome c biogenesis CcdA family protein n=1 Tax=Marinivivus vitaminiproducens TaxID=3035935 RepID=UPI0027A88197|nr:cytochrome c biogenesis CcdA family protein [Geminicoccaceae bacterium SCSIO 64248]
MTAFGLAFIAGLLTILNPCVLPLLPIVVGTAFQESHMGPIALGLGLAVSFAVFGTVVTAFGYAIGLDPALLRQIGAVVLLVCGVVLLVPQAQAGLATAMGPITSSAGSATLSLPTGGVRGQFLLGTVLGVVWAPCVGPTLGAAIAAASQGENVLFAGAVMTLFGLGAATSLVLFAYGSRQALGARRKSWQGAAFWAKPVLGVLLVAVGIAILSGIDKRIEAWTLSVMPTGLLDLTTRF